jgi:hypothetical protein
MADTSPEQNLAGAIFGVDPSQVRMERPTHTSLWVHAGREYPEWPSIDAFYGDTRARRWSPASDYGVHWSSGGRRWPQWRVSYLKDTGEIYAVRLSGSPCGPVRLLGVVTPDVGMARLHGVWYASLDRILDGWAEHGPETRSVEWVADRLAEAQP